MLKEISSYWTLSSVGYDKVIKSQFKNKQTVLKWENLLKEGLGGKERQCILDVGTGPGFFTILLSRLGHKVTAMDASAGMVETAARNFAAEGLQVRVYEGDAEDLHQEGANTFDAVVSRDVVWTLPDPLKAYEEWFRILKPGGTLIVFDGNYLFEEKKSLWRSSWYAAAWTLILLTERRVRRRSKKDTDLLIKLPFVNMLRPEADETALLHAGFRIQTIRRDFFPGYKRSLSYIKYGYQSGTRFMIIAKKADEE